jgi:adenine-specific DNA-methyltransferase
MSNIEKSFDEIKKYIDTELNNDKTLFKTSNDEPTPLDCCSEILNKIPNKLWSKKNLKILDPCAGYGNFEIILCQLLKDSYSTKDILEKIISFNETNEKRIDLINRIFLGDKYKLNITNYDFLKYPSDTKYDLQIANPPYAKFCEAKDKDGNIIMKRASKNHTLVRDFIEKSLSICNDGGYIVYIVPNNWMSLADRNTIIKLLTQYQFHHLDIGTSKKYFPKVGSSFTYFILEKTPFYKDFTVNCLYNKKLYSSMVTSEKRDFIPLCYNNLVQSILNKVLSGKKKFNIETTSDLHKYTKKHLINNEKTDVYKYKLIHTDKQTVYSKKPHKYQEGYKVFLSTTGAWNVFVDNCGMTQSIAFIRVNSEDEGIKYKKILDHKLYKFINDICRWGNFNCIRVLQRLSVPSDEDNIYKSLDITQEEVDFITNI